jgi:autotransporter-associated beta strand protein
VLVFGAASAYTGTTTVSAGTLRFGASGAIASSSSLIMNGGNLDPGGFNQNLGSTTFGLTAFSTIDFGTFPVELDFANSSGLSWTGSTLNLLNWDFGADKLRFGLDNSGLTSAQLAKIEFNGAGLGTAQLDSLGYVVPEPSTFALGLIGLGMMRSVRRRIV